jgi:hypothetical protein
MANGTNYGKGEGGHNKKDEGGIEWHSQNPRGMAKRAFSIPPSIFI